MAERPQTRRMPWFKRARGRIADSRLPKGEKELRDEPRVGEGSK